MPTEMSLWELIAGASPLVQAVMALLMLASVISWILIIQRALYLGRARRLALVFEDTFWSGENLIDIYNKGGQRTAGRDPSMGLEAIFRAGFKEFARLRQKGKIESGAIMDGAQRCMRIAISREQDALERHLPFLASVASVSPYIGLFGTVWGIMNSFRGLAAVHQATLATVAPGISEALIATAMGLFAAIPAVLAYNRFAARVDSLSSTYSTFAEELSSVLHRDVHAPIRLAKPPARPQ
ncbi:MAG: protein TolQ [Cellvibrionales bacterium]|nr:protein TolQ [Cellvibrionales bacterium]